MVLSTPRPRVSHFWLLLSLLLCAAAPAVAQTTSLAGSYQASPAVIRAEVSDWGVDCGVKPQSYTLSERPAVNVSYLGAHLVLGFPERRMRTDLCWSPNPLVKLASATAADNRWRAECRTPKGEAKQEVGQYTVTATGPYTLELVEESKYDWQLKGSHCVASVRITQQLERVATERPVEPKKPDANSKVDATKTPEPAPACVAGVPTRLRMRPSEARIEPGQRVCFTVQGVDAKGCAADLDQGSLRWELKKPDAARAQIVDGCFRAAASAADAEGNFRVSAVRDALRAEAAVAVVAADLSDITARRVASTPSPAEGPAPGAPRDINETGVQGAAVKRRDNQALWIGLGAVGIALLGIALVLVRRAKKPAPVPPRRSAPHAPGTPVAQPSAAAPTTQPLAPSPIAPPVVAAPVAERPAMASAATLPSEPMICPKCRRGYPPGAQRCEGDGTALVSYADFVRRAKAEAATTSAACPSCGAKVAAGDAFCGSCGRKMNG